MIGSIGVLGTACVGYGCGSRSYGNAYGAYGKTSSCAHYDAAVARRSAGKRAYRLLNIDQQIAKFGRECQESEAAMAALDTFVDTDGTMPQIYSPPTGADFSIATGQSSDGGTSILPIVVIGGVALLALGGAAYFFLGK